jgi:phospholipid transport system substrate-binding protein
MKFLILVAALACFVAVPVRAAENSTPSDVIRQFDDTLLDVMRNAKSLQFKGRYDKLAPKIDSTFNLPFMIQIASGTKWKSASDDERAQLAEAFRRVSVGTYAQRFDDFSGESFRLLGEQDGPSGTKLVSTEIARPAKDPVPITYVMRRFGDDWRVIDVILVGGISELATRRSEYTAVLNDKGPAGLITALTAKADQIIPR